MPRSNTIQDFWKQVDVLGENDCWEWQGGLNKDGYGRFRFQGVHFLSHRFSYEQIIGNIPNGLVIDHTCRNRRCVNPKHLEPVTNATNVKRGEKSQRTHCIRGHLLSGSNLKIRKNGTRFCRACDAQRARERRNVC